MSAWGTAPWENDSAADWFAGIFDATGFANRVELALNQDVNYDNHEEIRAAAYLLVALGRVYIWPIYELERHLELAIEKLEAIKKLSLFEGDKKFVVEIGKEIDVLQARLEKIKRNKKL